MSEVIEASNGLGFDLKIVDFQLLVKVLASMFPLEVLPSLLLLGDLTGLPLPLLRGLILFNNILQNFPLNFCLFSNLLCLGKFLDVIASLALSVSVSCQ